MKHPRRFGLLLHPTSLPGRFGIGDLGPEAHRWVDWAASAGATVWQVLPLGPTGFGDSPYQCFSAFAGNPCLVSPEALRDDGLLEAADLEHAPRFPADAVDYGAVIPFKLALLDRALERFRGGAAPALREPFERFAREQSAWLEDYALFAALKDEHRGAPWTEWTAPLVAREPAALEGARARLAPALEAQRFRQFCFFRQSAALRAHAASQGVQLLGDVPIFLAHDSADVWAHPELFVLDAAGRPTVVAGVPPDYFSKTGQLWGNPLYRWDVMQRDGYAWWIARLRHLFESVDAARLDHFRGFEAYWEVDASAPTAEHGRWVKGPGAELFEALAGAFPSLPIVAEDLGLITPEVVALRKQFDLPGMKVLQFAFGSGGSHEFLPHHHEENCVVYTGTHDNDTTRGHFEHHATAAEKHLARRYFACDDAGLTRALVRAAFASVARLAIVPLQDVLELGSEARMNLPGRAAGNWAWRFRWSRIGRHVAPGLAEMCELYERRGRLPAQLGAGE